MDTPWRIELFGRLCAKQGERSVTRFRTQKTGVLLAYLAYYSGQPHRREALIEMLWPEDSPEAGRNSFRVAINALRRALELPDQPEPLVTDRTYIELNPLLFTTDIAEFNAALQADNQDESKEDVEKVKSLSFAVELYHTGLLPDYEEAWVEAERQRLENAYLGALRKLTRLLAQARDFDRAIDYAWRAIRTDPLREDSHRSLMRLYMGIGRPTAALQQYRELEHVLKTELGAAPSAATRELAKQILAVRTPAAAQAPPSPPSSERSSPHQPASTESLAADSLLSPLTRFFGREEESALLMDMLRAPQTRLVTLLGPGGSGKTRLTLEVARRLRHTFPGGVWLVALADLAEARLIPGSIAETLGVQPDSDEQPLDSIIKKLTAQSEPMLLALDNYEQIAAEGGQVVRALLERVPALTCLVTSRERLNLAGEHIFHVLPLPTPTLPGTPERLMEFASVQLFLDRAQAVRPDFRLNKTNAATVAALCHRLEGLPLAIELAAAWVQTLTPAQMLHRLSRRFDLLVSRRADLPLRHRTLRATLEGSHRLLPPELQQFFARLAVFRGGWTMEAVETVCAEPLALDFLTQLRERSLIQVEESGEAMRFRMLETLREYAEEQIPDKERALLSRRHTEYFVRMSEEAYPQWEGANQSLWLEKMEVENENLRAALTWALSEQGDSDLALRLAGTLWRFWFIRGYPLEGRDWLEAALRRGEDASETVRAAALHAAGNLASHLGDYKTAREHYEACLAFRWRIGDLSGVARTLGNLGNLADYQGNYSEARALYDQSLSLCRQLKDRHGVANALQNLGNIAADQGDYVAARAHYEESLNLFRALGDQQGTANLLSNLGAVAHEQQDLVRAAALFEESLVLLRALNAKRSLAIALNNLGYVALDREDYSQAHALHEECLGLFRDLGDKEGIAYALEGLAIRAQADHETERAVCLLAAAETLRQAIGAPLPSPLRLRCDRALDNARSALSTEVFIRSQSQGQTMTLEQAIAYALGGSNGYVNAMIP